MFEAKSVPGVFELEINLAEWLESELVCPKKTRLTGSVREPACLPSAVPLFQPILASIRNPLFRSSSGL